MRFKRKRPELTLARDVEGILEQISKWRTESASRVERAKMICEYSQEIPIAAIAHGLSTSRPKAGRCIDKALQFGPLTALEDLPGSGKPAEITPEAKAWLMNLACQKPKDVGYSFELGTNGFLAKHAREYCTEAGHPSLAKSNRETVSKILKKVMSAAIKSPITWNDVIPNLIVK